MLSIADFLSGACLKSADFVAKVFLGTERKFFEPLKPAILAFSQRCRMRKQTVIVNDMMQRGYRYQLTEQAGRNFDPEFGPQLTPKEMLRLGVFCGKYMTDTRKEFPKT